MSALALAARGIKVTVLERDPDPPSDVEPSDSMRWTRRGVPQALHPHFFMGRLRLLLIDRYPALVEQLLAAGASEGKFEDYLHPLARETHHARVTDDRMRSINCRRTTFEMIVRRHVAKSPNVTMVSASRVRNLIGHRPASDEPLCVTGVEAEESGAIVRYEADVVIDASGRSSKLADALMSDGLAVDVEQRDSAIWYFTRHYRLKPGCDFPDSFGVPGAMFPDFIVGALPADNRTFTVTFQIYREDKEVAKALRNPDHFQAMCGAVGCIAPWVDPARSEPTSEVFGFAQMDCYWRRTVVRGKPQVLGYFPVGDCAIRTNPKFGRGCTWTTVAAHHLADLLAADLSPEERIGRYEEILIDEFRQDWETMRSIDVATEERFEVASGKRTPTLASRMSQWLAGLLDDATLLDSAVFREVWSGYHGLQKMSAWTRRPSVWLRLLRAELVRRNAKKDLAKMRTRPSRQALAAQSPD
jgi:2-polyprenyl-6-methoxyphenol hydroxylase-like FAD-dependent oxidoreductase